MAFLTSPVVETSGVSALPVEVVSSVHDLSTSLALVSCVSFILGHDYT